MEEEETSRRERINWERKDRDLEKAWLQIGKRKFRMQAANILGPKKRT
jgi:hypothetical protein